MNEAEIKDGAHGESPVSSSELVRQWECPCCCEKNQTTITHESVQTDETSCRKCGTIYFLDDVIRGLPNKGISDGDRKINSDEIGCSEVTR